MTSHDSTFPQSDRTTAPGLTRGLTLLFSLACALAVANVYFVQPLLDSITQDLRIAPGLAGTVVTATQAGYAVGLVFIVALGDRVNRKHLMVCQTLLSAVALAVAGCARQWPVLLGAMVMVGMLAVLVQVIVAYVAALASPQQRGRAVGSVTSGVVVGILLARLVSGGIADLAGWRTAYFVSAGLMLTLCVVLARAVPAISTPRPDMSYVRLIGSLFALFVTERTLRTRGLLALLIFAAFSVLWTAMVLPLSAAPLSLSHTQIGLFGLAGVAGALAASNAGRWADRGLSRRTTGIALALLTLSWLPTAFLQVSWLALIAGVIMLDFAVQAVHVTNQSLIFAARPDAQSRLVGAYMCFYSLGSAVGASAATQVYARWGWGAVCLLGALISAAALAWWAWTDLRPARAPGSRP
ncbi:MULTISPECIES: MFS transporter [unclassified Pseudomonas]|uniref:MFS transporter n=1 Tax=unclassified Pseudomonas TaxID=196821 RepID=UPI00091FC81E|nr:MULTISPECIES: MFS transporter [unclassified Pseudomonas]ROO41051.1 MFS transporter [Pseudomonas sp. AF76]SFX35082.1 Predicted arabinose efflux permease, MFS family [Pseudomonas sp. NFACC47-1]SFX69746.1 Predicted arabinose efflux permease, MFS family [Pseudomonas sp. NFACC43]